VTGQVNTTEFDGLRGCVCVCVCGRAIDGTSISNERGEICVSLCSEKLGWTKPTTKDPETEARNYSKISCHQRILSASHSPEM